MMRFHNAVAIVLALAFLPGTAAFGQNNKLLAPDHPDLHYSFFFFCENFSAWLDARGTALPANRTRLLQSAARYLNVNPTELPKISEICTSTAASLRRINADAQQYWDDETRNRRAPDSARVREFKARREAALRVGIDRLTRELSPAGWNGLHAHINGEHRAGIKVIQKSHP